MSVTTSATVHLIQTIQNESEIRKEIDAILQKSKTLSKPTFKGVLLAIVDHADKKYKRQEELLEVLRSINRKE